MTSPKPIPHGTPRGYNLHRARGEQPCDDCTHRYNTYREEVRALLDAGVVQVPLELLGALLIAAPTELEERVEQVLGATCVEVAIDAAERADEDEDPLAAAS